MRYLAGKAMVILFIMAISTAIYAQTNQSRLQASSTKPVSKELAALAATLSDAQNDVIFAATEYKESLERLLALQQEGVKRASGDVQKRKGLLALEIVSNREVEQSEQLLALEQASVEETKSKMGRADALLTEVTANDPMEAARRLLAQRKKRERTPRGRVYYVAFVIVGKITIYDYSGAINGQLIKYKNQIKHDSRRSR